MLKQKKKDKEKKKRSIQIQETFSPYKRTFDTRDSTTNLIFLNLVSSRRKLFKALTLIFFFSFKNPITVLSEKPPIRMMPALNASYHYPCFFYLGATD